VLALVRSLIGLISFVMFAAEVGDGKRGSKVVSSVFVWLWESVNGMQCAGGGQGWVLAQSRRSPGRCHFLESPGWGVGSVGLVSVFDRSLYGVVGTWGCRRESVRVFPPSSRVPVFGNFTWTCKRRGVVVAPNRV
jgi:hypothetical protein